MGDELILTRSFNGAAKTYTVDIEGNHIDKATGEMVYKVTTLGRVIRDARIRKGMTQRGLAVLVRGSETPYCSPQTMNNIEHDERLGEQYWQSLSDLLDIPMEVFIFYGLLVPINMVPSYEYPYHLIEDGFKVMRLVLDGYTDAIKKHRLKEVD